MNKKLTQSHPVFIYDDQEIQYKFNDNHPFNQDRLIMTVDLLRKSGALPDSALLTARLGDRCRSAARAFCPLYRSCESA